MFEPLKLYCTKNDLNKTKGTKKVQKLTFLYMYMLVNVPTEKCLTVPKLQVYLS